MEREAPLFLEARTWKVLETILDRKSSPMLNQNSLKKLQKSIPKPPEIEPKTLQSRGLEGIPLEIAFPSQIDPLVIRSWRCLGASWERLGRVLGPSWARLGSVLELSWSVLGRLGRILGASGDVLGASWNVLRILH